MKAAQRNLDVPVGISFSGGASSLWLIEAIIAGVIARPRHLAVFFSDTGDEHEWTYEEVSITEERCHAAGIDFVRTATHRNESISDAVLAACRGERTRIDQPPFWTENPGGGRGKLQQRCTQIWKSRALRRAQATWLKGQGLPKRIEQWIGFAAEEASRANKAIARHEVKWATLAFPAIVAQRNRDAQRADVERWRGRRAPRFSMCVECPFKDEARWKQTSARDLDKAIQIDEAIREGMQHTGVIEPCFLTDQLIPISQLVRGGRGQLPPTENPGCDGGHCFL